MTATVADVVGVLESLYDPAWAESWDAVGLVCGDPEAAVRRILFAVDPVESVVDEAVDAGVDLLVTHHPLYLRGTSSVAATTPKGRVVHRLVSAGMALHVAHTNADVAAPGVSDALARALGLGDLQPLQPLAGDPIDKLVVFVPHLDADRLIDALAAAGAGRLGDYSRCAYLLDGTGTFRPEPGARPAIGSVGRVETVDEVRLEMVLPRRLRPAVVRALLDVHPYEEPAYDLYELAVPPGRRGLGRVGRLPHRLSLREFVHVAAEALPATVWGLRAAGEPDRPVTTVAVCGGAGGELAGAAAAAGADVLLTADLRHHPASELYDDTGVALVDAAHWATEWPWLADAAARLREGLGAAGITVETSVSSRVTDPWTLHAPSSGGS
jgi:dinuclear metal center YbgI/SA1388 family protein